MNRLFEPTVFLVISSNISSGLGSLILKLIRPPNWVPYWSEAAPRSIWISSRPSGGGV